MTNPFEDLAGHYVVLRNDEGQHCLWPDSIPGPDGWRTVHGPAPRPECLEHVETHWTDLRPLSLQRQA